MTVLEPGVDGRTARGHRTRKAVVDALLALIHEGDLRPTAPRIAERARVSLRSIFQHYSDLETLFAEAGRRHLAQVQEMVEPLPGPDLPLVERIAVFVGQRARLLEFIAPVFRAASIQEPFSSQLQTNREFAVSASRREIEKVFAPELDARPREDRRELVVALDIAASSPAWEHLRVWSHLDVDAAQRVVVRTITALLRSPTSAIQEPPYEQERHFSE